MVDLGGISETAKKLVDIVKTRSMAWLSILFLLRRLIWRFTARALIESWKILSRVTEVVTWVKQKEQGGEQLSPEEAAFSPCTDD
jgi:hypothetical protein